MFVLKKAYLPADKCLHWVDFGGQSFASMARADTNTGGPYSRIYNATTNTLLLSVANPFGIVLFKLNGNLYAAYKVGATFNIYRWNGSNFSTLSVIGPNAVRCDDIRFYNNEVYLILNRHSSVGGDGSDLIKFNGTDGTGLSLLFNIPFASGNTVSRFDIDQATGDIYYLLQKSGSNFDTELRKLTQLGVDTLEYLIDNPPTITTPTYLTTALAFFDGVIYLTKLDVTASLSAKQKLSRITGGVETTIDTTTIRRGQTRMIVWSTKLYIMSSDGSSGANQFCEIYTHSGGTGPAVFMQQVFGRIPPNNGENGVGFFTDQGAELIVGTDVNFLTTQITCDLGPGSPFIIKTDETGENTNDGVITVNVSGSFSKQYSKDNVTFQLSNTFSGLAPGPYTIFIKDSVGCTLETDEITIVEFEAPEPPAPPVLGGQLLVNLKPLNLFNFITWFAADGPISFDHLCVEGECWDFPNNYLRGANKTVKHYPVVCPTELFSFYINFKNQFSDPNFSSFRVALITTSGIVTGFENIVPLVKDTYNDPFYNIYGNVTLDVTLDEGIYMMAIYNNVNNNVVFVSNEIQVMKVAKAVCETVRLQWKHDFNIYNYFYQSATEYVHNLRLRWNLIDETAEGTLVQYRSVSGGNLRNQSFELDFPYFFETQYFDKLAHRAMFVFQAHSLIIINNEEMVVKDIYKVDTGAEKIVKRGKISFYLQEFSTWNLYGPLIDITIIGSDDPLLLGDNGGFIKL